MHKPRSFTGGRIFIGNLLRTTGLTLILALGAVAADTGNSSLRPPTQPSAASPLLRVAVDPRVELLSIIFRLAGNPEYNQGRLPGYTLDVKKQFDAFADHPVVKLARRLRATRGVSYDACMSFAVHLADPFVLQPKVPLAPWPEGLDQRWTANDVAVFLTCARQFVVDTSFRRFIQDHQALYQMTESRLQELLAKAAHLEWFGDYFAERPSARFTAVPALLNGGACYGPHFRDTTGKEELFCILGVWETDAGGLPSFRTNMVDTIIHEFCHSYANPIIDRHSAELAEPGRLLYARVADRMRSQAYGQASTMLRESLVRACVIRYLRQYHGEEAARKAIRSEVQRGFLWMDELSNCLADYESHRQQYRTLDSFSPRLVAFFRDYAPKFAATQAALDSKRPKVISVSPADGAQDVDPALNEVRVVFDRPMTDHSWSMVGGGPHFPETTGQPHYDAARTTWTASIKLKPDWDYEFMLNGGQFDSFRSAENIPLKPVRIKFHTGRAKTD